MLPLLTSGAMVVDCCFALACYIIFIDDPVTAGRLAVVMTMHDHHHSATASASSHGNMHHAPACLSKFTRTHGSWLLSQCSFLSFCCCLLLSVLPASVITSWLLCVLLLLLLLSLLAASCRLLPFVTAGWIIAECTLLVADWALLYFSCFVTTILLSLIPPWLLILLFYNDGCCFCHCWLLLLLVCCDFIFMPSLLQLVLWLQLFLPLVEILSYILTDSSALQVLLGTTGWFLLFSSILLLLLFAHYFGLLPSQECKHTFILDWTEWKETDWLKLVFFIE